MVRRDKPLVLVVSPPCTVFSIANQGDVPPLIKAQAIDIIRFSMELCELQRRAGRHFIFEQPLTSRAWDLASMKSMVSSKGAISTKFNQCMYGLESCDSLGRAPAYKPTRILTNHGALAEGLCRTCNGGHSHVQLVVIQLCSHAARYLDGVMPSCGNRSGGDQEGRT